MDSIPSDLPAPVIIPNPQPPPRFNYKLLVGLGLVFIVILLILFFKIHFLRPTKSPSSQVPTPAIVTSTMVPSPTGIVPRLPLTELIGHQLITLISDQLWLIDFTAQGPNKSLLSDPKVHILDMSLSPSKSYLAYTFTDNSNHSGLRLLNLGDKSVTEFTSLSENKSVRYPVWSSDSVYLAVWNSGNGDVLYDMTTKRKLLEVPSSSGILGPIVFVPGQTKISYVDANKIYESDYLGQTKSQVVDQVYSANPPDPYYYSPDSQFLAYHNLLGQLVLFSRSDNSLQVLAEANSPGHSMGQVITFIQNYLIYYDLKKSTYQPAVDLNPIYTFKLNEKVGQPLVANRQTPMSLGSPLTDPTNSKIAIHHHGYRIYDFTGRIMSNCDDTDLGYDETNHDVYSSPLKLWSPDGKYLLNASLTQITQTSSCSLSANYDPQTPQNTLWLK